MKLEYKYNTEVTNSLNTGYFLEQKDLDVIVASKTKKVKFGQLPDEKIEVSVYDKTNNLIAHKRNDNQLESESIQRTYTDLDNNLIKYNFDSIKSGMFTVESASLKQLIVSPTDDLKDIDLGPGSYKVAYTLMTDVIGGNDEKLEISEISPSRTELKVVPAKRANEDVYINKQFSKVKNNSFFGKEITDDILININEKQIDKIFLSTVEDNERLVQEIKLLYALPRDIDMINFLLGIFRQDVEKDKTILYQLENWLFSQNEEEVTFEQIRELYDNTSDTLIRFHLNKKSTVVSNEFEEYISYLKGIFDQIFTVSIDDAESLYFERNNIFLKHFINFGNNVMFPVVNYIASGENVSIEGKHEPLLLKLAEPLLEDYTVGDKFIFSRLTTNPVYNDFIVYKNNKITLNKIKGPNFFANDSENLFSTKEYTLDSVADSGSLDILLKKEDDNNKINIDYSNFSKFIKFSSATARVNNYEYKLNRINELEDEIDLIDVKLVDSPNDIYHLADRSVMSNEIQTIKEGFDGYEQFLFDNPDWYIEHSKPVGTTTLQGTYETSASLYDEWNDDSLISNTPDFIIQDSENGDYVNFLNMVGQTFDEIWMHLEHTPTVARVENRDDIGLSNEMIKTMLTSLGWTPESGNDNEDLLVALTGDTEDSVGLEDIPAKRRTQLIWKRILNSLPHILKTKGSEECIRSLFTCYGIPRSLYSIREFGGIRKIDKTKDDNQFIFDNDYYALHFDGKGEYLNMPWDKDIKTVEFKFAFDTHKTYDEGEIFRLMSCDDRWVIGVQRERGSTWGKVFFTLAFDTGSNAEITTLMSDELPVFNGDLFSVMLRRNDVDNFFNLSAAQLADETFVDQVPIKYDLVVKRAIDDRIVFEDTQDFYFTGSYNANFRASGSDASVYVGNFSQITSSIVPDPEAFYGVIDQVRLWKNPVSDKRFDSHVYFINGYDSDFPEDTVDNLALHLNFNQPQDLYSGSADAVSGSITIPNNSLSLTKLGDIQAINFHDLSTSKSYDDTLCDDCCDQKPEVFQYVSASFPWHFKKFQTRELVKIPDYGAAKFRSNNVNYITNEIEKPLFYDSRTTKPSSKTKTKGSNGLGVFFSPIDDLNTRIIEFFGDFDISDFIGDPRETYKNQYKTFDTFKKTFYKTGLSNIDFQGYINLIKSYFDNSLFKHLQTIVPAKATFRTGILVEPTILERNKVQNKPSELTIHNDIETEKDVIREVSSEMLFGNVLDGNGLVDELKPNVDATTSHPRNFYTFVDDQPDTHASEIYSEDGIVHKGGKRYYAEVMKEIRTLYRFDDTVSNDNYVPVTQSFERINLIDLGDTDLSASLSFPDSRVLDGYDRRHFKFKRNFFGGISIQTEDSTIDEESGVPNGSEVVVLTTVDRGTVNVGTEGEGVVLDSDS